MDKVAQEKWKNSLFIWSNISALKPVFLLRVYNISIYKLVSERKK